MTERQERAMVRSEEARGVGREAAYSLARLGLIDSEIDRIAWRDLLRLRVFTWPRRDAGPEFHGFDGMPEEALAEFPPDWVAAARAERLPTSYPPQVSAVQVSADRDLPEAEPDPEAAAESAACSS